MLARRYLGVSFLFFGIVIKFIDWLIDWTNDSHERPEGRAKQGMSESPLSSEGDKTDVCTDVCRGKSRSLGVVPKYGR